MAGEHLQLGALAQQATAGKVILQHQDPDPIWVLQTGLLRTAMVTAEAGHHHPHGSLVLHEGALLKAAAVADATKKVVVAERRKAHLDIGKSMLMMRFN